MKTTKTKSLIIMALLTAIVAIFFACSSGNNDSGSVESGSLKGSSWSRSASTTGDYAYSYTYTYSFTSDTEVTYTQSGWHNEIISTSVTGRPTNTRRKNVNQTSKYKYIYAPELMEGVIDNRTIFSISDDFETLSTGGAPFTRK